MGEQVTNGSSIVVLLVVHMVISILSFIVANQYEKSIITDKVNKYLFFAVSLLYSCIAPYLLVGSLVTINPVPLQLRFCLIGGVTGFLLTQVVVYRCLNKIEED
ncbi:hypothetical protein [Halobacillus sp. A5]|uniref:hypothetical protein n=1 Tax=Halobacillus sp. A5 TaxID=2880263 RepID=UPI0020A6C93D|nr:hypothetical protein [Halobacillus sp. A5]MCP3026561.1 hypothetical protein [Halobacillus sp. A5]